MFNAVSKGEKGNTNKVTDPNKIINPEKLTAADYKFLKTITPGAQWKTVHPGVKGETK